MCKSEGHCNPLITTQVLPNPSEGITNDLDPYSKVKKNIIISLSFFVMFWIIIPWPSSAQHNTI